MSGTATPSGCERGGERASEGAFDRAASDQRLTKPRSARGKHDEQDQQVRVEEGRKEHLPLTQQPVLAGEESRGRNLPEGEPTR